jgi:hypothetical protein
MRDEQRRIDCVPCAKWKESPLEEDTEVTSTMSDRSFADNLVKNYYAPILVKIPVAIVVVRFFFLFFFSFDPTLLGFDA